MRGFFRGEKGVLIAETRKGTGYRPEKEREDSKC